MDRTHMRNVRSVSRSATDEIVGVNRRVHNGIEDMGDRIDRLTLICEALWELLEEQTELTVHDLERRITVLDTSDGYVDRRRRRTAMRCECGSMAPITALACYFCGAPVSPDTPFDTV